ncbi:hypothetical protein COLO4_18413 [Corchorus olitorius]|uniref:Peptidase S8/S53 domain-containing protein n=1 Tax=Corchorus olitorius TaxID=93759 RepID=A0A1R3J966_9ROSI|nr:hypothetical protein COLO4_18413 [Corchorus olitorius]
MLQTVLKQSSVENYLIRSYRRSFNGFAAKLTKEEAKKLASIEGVVSVFPSKIYQLQTTRSWDFMGFNETVKRNHSVESDVIVGVIDSGIWPESESFNDQGFGPPPTKWKGACGGLNNFTCNNKLIGARFYSSSDALDQEGHGTHTASTAAGNNVKDVSFFGLAKGTARGAVPSARIAAYRVCNSEGCSSEDILAAFDDAVADGVDIITISIGSDSSSEFYQDPIAIGAFHAAEKGLLVTQSAGNSGDLGPQRVTSVAPWILTVAASSTDRLFIDKVVLGNGKTLNGFAIHPFSLNGTKFPLVTGKQVKSENCIDDEFASICFEDCLNETLVKDKIVLCDELEGFVEAQNAGAVGSIVKSAFDNVSFVVSLPASALSSDDYDLVLSYHNSTKKPIAEIQKSETIKDSSAPIVAAFSSKGPNFIVPDILKPDISAPGVDILAAYSPVASPSTFPMDPSSNPDGEFGYGSGHVNPVKAINPGLIYEADKGDYISFLCSIGYGEGTIRQITGDKNSSCSETSKRMQPKDFNYPSLTAFVAEGKSFSVSFHRTVTNVGEAKSTYKVEVSSKSKLEVKVKPDVLSFKSLKEKKSYNVTVMGEALSNSSMVATSLVWSDGTHSVRSPIVIHTYEGVQRSDGNS